MAMIHANRYNELPSFEDQTKEFSDETLKELGAILLKHDAQAIFGLEIRHRHFELDEDEVMCHRSPALCAPVPAPSIQADKLQDATFSINDDGTCETLEYTWQSSRQHLDDFAQLRAELYTNMRTKALLDRLAVFRLDSFMGLSPCSEVLMPAVRGHAFDYAPVEVGADDIDSGGYVNTAWAFTHNPSGDIDIHRLRRCEIRFSGEHRVHH